MKPLSHGRLPQLVEALDWYALLVPPQREFAAQDILRRYGISTFCPFESVWRYKSRYTKEKELRHFPIMPRYVFAGFDRSPDWYLLFQLPIVRAVVGIGGEPKPVTGMPAFIRKFSNGLRRPAYEARMRTHREYGIGHMAVIAEGALAGRSVVVQSIENGHAFFRMEMFGVNMLLNLPSDQLEAA